MSIMDSARLRDCDLRHRRVSWVLSCWPSTRRGPSGWFAGGRRRLLRLQRAGRHLVSSSRLICCALSRSLRCARLGAPCRTTRTNL